MIMIAHPEHSSGELKMLTDGRTDGRTQGRTQGRTDDRQKVITIEVEEDKKGKIIILIIIYILYIIYI